MARLVAAIIVLGLAAAVVAAVFIGVTRLLAPKQSQTVVQVVVTATAVPAQAVIPVTPTSTSQPVATTTPTVAVAPTPTATATSTPQATATLAPTATVAPSVVQVNKPLVIQKVDYGNESILRAVFGSVDLTLVSMSRESDASIVCTFSLWNHNSTGSVHAAFDEQSYVLSSSGTRYKATSFQQGGTIVAGERQTITVRFNASEKGVTGKIAMHGYVGTETGTGGDLTWQPLDVTLP